MSLPTAACGSSCLPRLPGWSWSRSITFLSTGCQVPRRRPVTWVGTATGSQPCLATGLMQAPSL
eukprot:3129845-Pyramimonas_sp.AAC.1